MNAIASIDAEGWFVLSILTIAVIYFGILLFKNSRGDYYDPYD